MLQRASSESQLSQSAPPPHQKQHHRERPWQQVQQQQKRRVRFRWRAGHTVARLSRRDCMHSQAAQAAATMLSTTLRTTLCSHVSPRPLKITSLVWIVCLKIVDRIAKRTDSQRWRWKARRLAQKSTLLRLLRHAMLWEHFAHTRHIPWRVTAASPGVLSRSDGQVGAWRLPSGRHLEVADAAAAMMSLSNVASMSGDYYAYMERYQASCPKRLPVLLLSAEEEASMQATGADLKQACATSLDTVTRATTCLRKLTRDMRTAAMRSREAAAATTTNAWKLEDLDAETTREFLVGLHTDLLRSDASLAARRLHLLRQLSQLHGTLRKFVDARRATERSNQSEEATLRFIRTASGSKSRTQQAMTSQIRVAGGLESPTAGRVRRRHAFNSGRNAVSGWTELFQDRGVEDASLEESPDNGLAAEEEPELIAKTEAEERSRRLQKLVQWRESIVGSLGVAGGALTSRFAHLIQLMDAGHEKVMALAAESTKQENLTTMAMNELEKAMMPAVGVWFDRAIQTSSLPQELVAKAEQEAEQGKVVQLTKRLSGLRQRLKDKEKETDQERSIKLQIAAVAEDAPKSERVQRRQRSLRTPNRLKPIMPSSSPCRTPDRSLSPSPSGGGARSRSKSPDVRSLSKLQARELLQVLEDAVAPLQEACRQCSSEVPRGATEQGDALLAQTQSFEAFLAQFDSSLKAKRERSTTFTSASDSEELVEEAVRLLRSLEGMNNGADFFMEMLELIDEVPPILREQAVVERAEERLLLLRPAVRRPTGGETPEAMMRKPSVMRLQTLRAEQRRFTASMMKQDSDNNDLGTSIESLKARLSQVQKAAQEAARLGHDESEAVLPTNERLSSLASVRSTASSERVARRTPSRTLTFSTPSDPQQLRAQLQQLRASLVEDRDELSEEVAKLQDELRHLTDSGDVESSPVSKIKKRVRLKTKLVRFGANFGSSSGRQETGSSDNIGSGSLGGHSPSFASGKGGVRWHLPAGSAAEKLVEEESTDSRRPSKRQTSKLNTRSQPWRTAFPNDPPDVAQAKYKLCKRYRVPYPQLGDPRRQRLLKLKMNGMAKQTKRQMKLKTKVLLSLLTDDERRQFAMTNLSPDAEAKKALMHKAELKRLKSRFDTLSSLLAFWRRRMMVFDKQRDQKLAANKASVLESLEQLGKLARVLAFDAAAAMKSSADVHVMDANEMAEIAAVVVERFSLRGAAETASHSVITKTASQRDSMQMQKSLSITGAGAGGPPLFVSNLMGTPLLAETKAAVEASLQTSLLHRRERVGLGSRLAPAAPAWRNSARFSQSENQAGLSLDARRATLRGMSAIHASRMRSTICPSTWQVNNSRRRAGAFQDANTLEYIRSLQRSLTAAGACVDADGTVALSGTLNVDEPSTPTPLFKEFLLSILSVPSYRRGGVVDHLCDIERGRMTAFVKSAGRMSIRSSVEAVQTTIRVLERIALERDCSTPGECRDALQRVLVEAFRFVINKQEADAESSSSGFESDSSIASGTARAASSKTSTQGQWTSATEDGEDSGGESSDGLQAGGAMRRSTAAAAARRRSAEASQSKGNSSDKKQRGSAAAVGRYNRGSSRGMGYTTVYSITQGVEPRRSMEPNKRANQANWSRVRRQSLALGLAARRKSLSSADSDETSRHGSIPLAADLHVTGQQRQGSPPTKNGPSAEEEEDGGQASDADSSPLARKAGRALTAAARKVRQMTRSMKSMFMEDSLKIATERFEKLASKTRKIHDHKLRARVAALYEKGRLVRSASVVPGRYDMVDISRSQARMRRTEEGALRAWEERPSLCCAELGEEQKAEWRSLKDAVRESKALRVSQQKKQLTDMLAELAESEFSGYATDSPRRAMWQSEDGQPLITRSAGGISGKVRNSFFRNVQTKLKRHKPTDDMAAHTTRAVRRKKSIRLLRERSTAGEKTVWSSWKLDNMIYADHTEAGDEKDASAAEAVRSLAEALETDEEPKQQRAISKASTTSKRSVKGRAQQRQSQASLDVDDLCIAMGGVATDGGGGGRANREADWQRRRSQKARPHFGIEGLQASSRASSRRCSTSSSISVETTSADFQMCVAKALSLGEELNHEKRAKLAEQQACMMQRRLKKHTARRKSVAFAEEQPGSQRDEEEQEPEGTKSRQSSEGDGRESDSQQTDRSDRHSVGCDREGSGMDSYKLRGRRCGLMMHNDLREMSVRAAMSVASALQQGAAPLEQNMGIPLLVAAQTALLADEECHEALLASQQDLVDAATEDVLKALQAHYCGGGDANDGSSLTIADRGDDGEASAGPCNEEPETQLNDEPDTQPSRRTRRRRALIDTRQIAASEATPWQPEVITGRVPLRPLSMRSRMSGPTVRVRSVGSSSTKSEAQGMMGREREKEKMRGWQRLSTGHSLKFASMVALAQEEPKGATAVSVAEAPNAEPLCVAMPTLQHLNKSASAASVWQPMCATTPPSQRGVQRSQQRSEGAASVQSSSQPQPEQPRHDLLGLLRRMTEKTVPAPDLPHDLDACFKGLDSSIQEQRMRGLSVSEVEGAPTKAAPLPDFLLKQQQQPPEVRRRTMFHALSQLGIDICGSDAPAAPFAEDLEEAAANGVTKRIVNSRAPSTSTPASILKSAERKTSVQPSPPASAARASSQRELESPDGHSALAALLPRLLSHARGGPAVKFKKSDADDWSSTEMLSLPSKQTSSSRVLDEVLWPLELAKSQGRQGTDSSASNGELAKATVKLLAPAPTCKVRFASDAAWDRGDAEMAAGSAREAPSAPQQHSGGDRVNSSEEVAAAGRRLRRLTMLCEVVEGQLRSVADFDKHVASNHNIAQPGVSRKSMFFSEPEAGLPGAWARKA
eukprot:TRINITY_DN18420_c0_g1_i2.p1 TRINITY_DN18420_c0_g1~~TRINITY_DN18420_c0_g1_i2.p1  ORF type:complete len:2836 (-),score=612.83 TRINITY_DN18420_c0_g1_i2:59-8566(-)